MKNLLNCALTLILSLGVSACTQQTIVSEAQNGQHSIPNVALSAKMWVVGDELSLVLPSDVLFETGSAGLRAEAAPLLDKVSGILLARGGNCPIRISVYTDELGRYGAQKALSLARAKTILNALWQRGIPGDRMFVQTRSYHDAVASNRLLANSSYNRRIEIHTGINERNCASCG